ncbi:Gfo/Idh/MocA family protein [Variovorax sp. HJSM1_2]|uniref:Gfo/Idh/MocA family protein n=1 Tax=Variovorax sp. HJSM1_2 TaxID=3366263 RepID=UPI003BED15CF
MKKIGVALVGLGPGAEPHLASFSALQERMDLRWCVTRDIAKVGQVHQKRQSLLLANVRLTSDLNEVLADAAVQAVVLATPANTHLAIARQTLAAGKHTLVEKPLDVSLQRAEELVQIADASGLCFGVVLQHRFRPAAVRLRELLNAGELGPLQAGILQVPWWRSQAGYYDQPGRGTLERDGGGVLLTQAIHSIDLFRSLVGVRKVVAAQVVTTATHQMETEDFVSALLTLGNGAPGNLMASTAMYPGRPESMELVFSHANVSLVGGRLQVQHHDGRTEVVEGDAKTGSGDSIMDFSPEAHTALHRDFLDAITHGHAPTVSGREALLTHRLIEEILSAGAEEPQRHHAASL